MIRFVVIGLVAALLLFILFSIKHERITLRVKFGVSILVMIACTAAYFYESALGDRHARSLELVTLFNQGKALKCGETEVKNDKFNYEFGTGSFIAKREFKELSSVKIGIESCEVK